MSVLSEALPRRLDRPLVGLIAFLTLGVGLPMIRATTAGTVRADLAGRQALFLLLGAIVMAAALAVDYRILLQYSPGLYVLSLLPLLYLPLFGPTIAGAKSWLRLGGGFQIQPSELARVTTILLVAWILENDDRPFLSLQTFLVIAGTVALPMVLIMLQPDLGVAMTYAPILLGAMFFGGVRIRAWIAAVLFAAALAGASWFVLKDYQKDRIRTFLDPSSRSRGAGYQVRQARIAIGAGGVFGNLPRLLTGQGLRKDSQSRLGFLPVRHTDFLFAALAEEAGFLGVSIVLAAYVLLLLRCFDVAREARDRGGAMLTLLVASVLAVQIIVNVAMNIGLLPTTGITLPLLSYGGSSMLATMGALGLVLSVAYRRFVNV